MPAGQNAGGRKASGGGASTQSGPRTYAEAESMAQILYAQSRLKRQEAARYRAQASQQEARTKRGRIERAMLEQLAGAAESQAEELARRGFITVSRFREANPGR